MPPSPLLASGGCRRGSARGCIIPNAASAIPALYPLGVPPSSVPLSHKDTCDGI